MSKTICPHCGKPVSSPDKLAWHLSRECPALVAITAASTSKTSGNTTPSDRER
jgi:hypothetical protein